MASAYSIDLRGKVLLAYDRGRATKEIATSFGVSPAWARRVKQRRREHGEIAPRAMGGARRLKIDRLRLAALVAEQPDATLAELRERIETPCSVSGIDKALRALALTFKKRRSTRPSRIVPTSRCGVRSGPNGSRPSICIA